MGYAGLIKDKNLMKNLGQSKTIDEYKETMEQLRASRTH
jgi:hypothetical protein